MGAELARNSFSMAKEGKVFEQKINCSLSGYPWGNKNYWDYFFVQVPLWWATLLRILFITTSAPPNLVNISTPKFQISFQCGKSRQNMHIKLVASPPERRSWVSKQDSWPTGKSILGIVGRLYSFQQWSQLLDFYPLVTWRKVDKYLQWKVVKAVA